MKIRNAVRHSVGECEWLTHSRLEKYNFQNIKNSPFPQYEREQCVSSAQEYLATDPSGRDDDVPIIVVKQGHEPPSFTGFFGAWDAELFEVMYCVVCV